MMKRIKGFTLIELLLVITVSTAILMMFLGYTIQQGQQARRDKTVMQVQQIMNAALAFYTQNGRWPSLTGNLSGGANAWLTLQTGGELIDQNFIPQPVGAGGIVYSPYANTYFTGWNTNNNNFYVATQVQTNITAQIISGQLPFGFVTPTNNLPNTVIPTTCNLANCYVVATIPPPGQNLNNARSVNFASIYHASACVPAPVCPVGMIPQIFVVPTSVSGVNDAPTGCTNNAGTGCSVNVYPISSYNAYAVGSVTGNIQPGPNNYNYAGAPYYLTNTTSTMPTCNRPNAQGVNVDRCWASYNTSGVPTAISASGYYWRVCLGIITERGAVTPAALSGSQPSPWGLLQGTVMAITRCVPGNTTTGNVTEQVGSDFTVFSPTGN